LPKVFPESRNACVDRNLRQSGFCCEPSVLALHHQFDFLKHHRNGIGGSIGMARFNEVADLSAQMPDEFV